MRYTSGQKPHEKMLIFWKTCWTLLIIREIIIILSDIIILSEVSEREITHDITYMCNLKYGTNEPIYRTETESQTQRTDLWLPRGEGAGQEKDGLGVWG